MRGNLPWQNIKIKGKKDKYAKILNKKKEVSSQELGKDFPKEFSEILEYFKNLGYTEDPNYEMCWKKMINVLERENQAFDYIYDWTTNVNIKAKKKRDSSVGKKNFKRNSRKHFTTNHEKVPDEDGNIKLKVKDVDEDGTESGISNRAAIDEFDAPNNQSTQEETQCCNM